MIALMECQTRQEAVWVSEIKLLSLLSLSLYSTLLLDNVGKNVHHTLFITCLKWINFFYSRISFSREGGFLEEIPQSVIYSKKDCKEKQKEDYSYENRALNVRITNQEGRLEDLKMKL